MQFEEKAITIRASARHKIYGHAAGYIVPPHFQPDNFEGDSLLWILPEKEGNAYKITAAGYAVQKENGAARITLADGYTQETFPARPVCDFFGQRVRFDMPDGLAFERAYAHFYWDNLLPQIAARTFLRHKTDIRDGYVLSTLNPKAYAGTYPAVDHEFHIKGRFAVGGRAEAAQIRRMLELQFKIMREDKKGLSRNVCAVQPNGAREYKVWRSTKNLRHRAQMFRVTANVELMENLYLYYSMTKDIDFLQKNIAAAEKSCGYIERFVHPKTNLLHSHVYYEDQVIKNGAVMQAQCLAANGFRLMSELEMLLARKERADHYRALGERLGGAAVQPFPAGFWDENNERFIDWVDKKGRPHDHIHLLANELPVLFGYATERQAACVKRLLKEHEDVFQKFPSFVAAKVEDYSRSEIGNSPYDLCAAGRYWCWDAAYLAKEGDGTALKRQLLQVIVEGEKEAYLMGERYDMNHVYYNTGEDAARNWHGASHYYEYPNVFLHVLINKYLGVAFGFQEDIILDPKFGESGTVRLEMYGIEYAVGEALCVTNISTQPLQVFLPRYAARITLQPSETRVF